MNQNVTTKLEQTIINLAEKYLDELRHYSSTPSDDEGRLRENFSYTFTQIMTLTNLVIIEDTGLSEKSAAKLQLTHDEALKLGRTFRLMFEGNLMESLNTQTIQNK